MVDRKDMGSWLEGSPQGNSSNNAQWQKQVGVTTRGSGSMATMGRRVLALMVDWGIAMGISWMFFNYHQLATLGVFALEQFLLVSTLGFSIGHRLFGLKVRPEEPNTPYVGFLRGGLRSVLVCLVLPAVIWDENGRGLHDRAAKTILVRR